MFQGPRLVYTAGKGLHGRLTGFHHCFTEVLLNLDPVLLSFTEFRPCFTEFRPVLLSLVSVLLSLGCSRAPAGCSRAESDEERAPGAACLRCPWGYLTTISRVPVRVHLATLRHFDSKVRYPGQNGPLIPCRRRLLKMEI